MFTRRFGDNRVLQGVNLSIASGTSMVIIGGSGTGKSVLLKCILGLVRPDAGTITLDGQDVTKGKSGRRDAFLARFGMLFQGGALFDSAARLGERRLPAGAWPEGAAQTQAREVAIEKLRRVGLKPEVADLYPRRAVGRHAEARRPCPRHRGGTRDHLL
jgi:phospholipid/cholesterol/gamma-HCH transport system ATP-binding protein